MPGTRQPSCLTPLSPRITLGQLLHHAPAAGACGLWLEGLFTGAAPSSLRLHAPTATLDLVLSSDLGLLIRRTSTVLVRHQNAISCLGVERLAAMRLLEIEAAAGAVVHPLCDASPEGLLAGYAAAHSVVSASRIRYLG